MEKEFNLSKEIMSDLNDIRSIPIEKVKEFIKLLKEDTGCQPINSREKQIIALFKERIDRLAGEDLK